MKKLMKIFVILGLLPMFFACATNDKQEEKFVNPIFYQTMEPVSSTAWQTIITPTIHSVSNLGDIYTTKCFMTENKIDSVTLNCEGPEIPEMKLTKEDRYEVKYQIDTDENNDNWIYIKEFDTSLQGTPSHTISTLKIRKNQ